ncbi:3-methyl-2-oxobutanoate hydroxymethyltransferase [Gordoniibacillus kamchatkensis]|uniref:3-methyl-2-oxobutanoate hydroxymethyltransferase n=1 Tax=Gordoniibacillus kamchatkensis TaxID=1590651 RepID=A0ABR5AGS2_9BACL|nr:3-methyl-2-oxobutanoate hydroxymethyltransferase [Paenibacillus sp. VKM B-2647]KIL40028.1 3-methyl-2-oxobutanoate hydroxymethyltransferase [Paenibacillus sp. VKM B-2647]
MEGKKPVTVSKLRKMKQDGQPIAMVTAYDYPSAKLAEEAGSDIILVGDSLGNVVLGYDTTVPVTLDDMLHHTKAVTRGAKATFVVADMPFLTYHGSIDATLGNAARLMQEGLAHALKLEGGAEIAQTVRTLTQAGIPVMGHLGLTPQSVHQIGGYKIQGKTSEQAQKLLQDALALEQAGAFAIVLELITAELAEWITSQLAVPTIGIGSGAGCDGQVLVYHDLLRYDSGAPAKKFVQTYANIGDTIRGGIAQYVQDVKERKFPLPKHAFAADGELLTSLYGGGVKI